MMICSCDASNKHLLTSSTDQDGCNSRQAAARLPLRAECVEGNGGKDSKYDDDGENAK